MKANVDQYKDHIKRFRYDKLKQQKKRNPDFREVAKVLLSNTTPSRLAEISAHKELDEIQLAARDILELGLYVSVPTDVSNCACVHLYSFYRNNSVTDYDRKCVAVACLFLACKTEDHPRALSDVLIAAYNHWYSSKCKEIIRRHKHLECRLNDLTSSLAKSTAVTNFKQGHHSSSYSGGGPGHDNDSISPHSIKSPSSAGTTPNSDFKSPASSGVCMATTPQPTTPDEYGNYAQIGVSPRSPGDHLNNYYNRHNLQGGNYMHVQRLKADIKCVKDELKKMPPVKYLNPNNKKECVIPPRDFYSKTKPKIEAYESDLLCSIGFCTIVSLPHCLIVEAKNRFVNVYGENCESKLNRIVYTAYDLATRVVSLIPVNNPRNEIAPALLYLCGPFSHPVPYEPTQSEKPWWEEIYDAKMTEKQLIELSELICDAWISTKDYYQQVHQQNKLRLEKQAKMQQAERVRHQNPRPISQSPGSPMVPSSSPKVMFSPDSQFQAESPLTNTSSPLSIDSLSSLDFNKSSTKKPLLSSSQATSFSSLHSSEKSHHTTTSSHSIHQKNSNNQIFNSNYTNFDGVSNSRYTYSNYNSTGSNSQGSSQLPNPAVRHRYDTNSSKNLSNSSSSGRPIISNLNETWSDRVGQSSTSANRKRKYNLSNENTV